MRAHLAGPSHPAPPAPPAAAAAAPAASKPCWFSSAVGCRCFCASRRRGCEGRIGLGDLTLGGGGTWSSTTASKYHSSLRKSEELTRFGGSYCAQHLSRRWGYRIPRVDRFSRSHACCIVVHVHDSGCFGGSGRKIRTIPTCGGIWVMDVLGRKRLTRGLLGLNLSFPLQQIGFGGGICILHGVQGIHKNLINFFRRQIGRNRRIVPTIVREDLVGGNRSSSNRIILCGHAPLSGRATPSS